MERCGAVLCSKAEEYATGADPFHNFHKAAELQKTTPIQALGGMMAMHTISVYDMIETGKEYPIELWDEKICDHINYLLLLRAMVAEATEEENNA